jgi:hypothetical protein
LKLLLNNGSITPQIRAAALEFRGKAWAGAPAHHRQLGPPAGA